MTEEFDVIHAFQQIRQRLHDTRQPRNLGLIAEALQPTIFQLNPGSIQAMPFPTDLDWRPVPIPVDWQIAYRENIGQAARYIHDTLDDLEEDNEDDDDNDDSLINIMDCMAWAYLPEEIRDEICHKFYHGERVRHQILLTTHDPVNSRPVVTAALVEVKRDDFGTHLSLCGEVIAWYATNDPLGDEYSPIFFDYEYRKLGTFFLGAAQLLWGALGYQTYILDARYISDEAREPWEEIDDAELSAYTFHQVKQVKQLSGNFGVFKKKIRNARRRRNLY